MDNKYKNGFTIKIKKKLDKTKEGRQGDLLRNRRNNRNNRVIMQLNTFTSLIKDDPSKLNGYKKGYVVALSPEEYFDAETKKRKNNLSSDLILGENCIVYYQDNDEFWDKFNPLDHGDNWKQVVENTSALGDWSGEFAINITNAEKKKVSFITRKAQAIESPEFEWMNKNIKNVKSRAKDARSKTMGGKGLGNYDFDYCSDENQERILFQLSYLIWRTSGIEEYIKFEIKNNPYNFPQNEINKYKSKGVDKWINESKEYVYEYVDKNKLNVSEKLETNLITYNDKVSCPLCRIPIKAKELTEKVTQDLGRESSQQTITEIVLMHIEPLRPGKFNHIEYNLAWGHKECNMIQENKTINETLLSLKKILENNKYKVKKNNQ